MQNKIDTLQLAIANLNARSARRRPRPTSLRTRPSSGTCRAQLTTLQDQLQNYQFYASQGVTTEAGQVISTATVPSKPVSPKTLEWAVLALIFGLILGIGIALLVNALGRRARTDRRSGPFPVPLAAEDRTAPVGRAGTEVGGWQPSTTTRTGT